VPSSYRLPDPLTTLIGRKAETRRITELLGRSGVRHVTLCGAGGIGKTRIALRVAEMVANDFDEGVLFVDLSPLSDPGRVAPSIAASLELPASTNDVEATLIEQLADRNLLIVLDNFEHLMAAAPLVPRLAGACPGVVFLVTSREKLGAYGEQVVEIEPMSLPDPNLPVSVAAVSASEAVHLFAARAAEAQSGFSLTDDNAGSVVSICRRLNGLPLAIELAAARIAHLPPQAIDANFERLLPLLEGGRRDLPARLRTMREAIHWGYELLSAEEQSLFCRLSVFAGGCSIEAATAVGLAASTSANGEVDTLRLLSSLVDKSMLKREDKSEREPRYAMLEPIREFGLEQLAIEEHEFETRRAHADYFLSLSEKIGPELRSGDPGPWLRQLDSEIDNFRAALDWLLKTAPPGDTAAIKLCNGSAHFWLWRGHTTEARRWLELGVERAGSTVSQETAVAFLQLGHLGYGNAADSYANYERSLAIYRKLDHQRGIAGLLSCLGMTAELMGNYDDARRRLKESRSLFDELSDRHGIAQASYHLGTLASRMGEYARSQEFLETARGEWEQLGDEANVAFAIAELGRLYRLQRRVDEAADLLRWSLSRLERIGIKHGQALLCYELGEVALLRGTLARASDEFRESMRIFRELNLVEVALADSIEGMARIALATKQPETALMLFSSVIAWRNATGYRSSPAEERQRYAGLRSIQKALGNARYDTIWIRGKLLQLTEARDIATAIDTPSSEIQPALAPRDLPGDEPLTAREGTVLCLVANGLSNQQIADHLAIEIRTVTTHLSRIFGKLGVSSRTHAAALAFRHGFCVDADR
jgi:predicted ATPase/DNA-binding CsgD family transcriptional regulator